MYKTSQELWTRFVFEIHRKYCSQYTYHLMIDVPFEYPMVCMGHKQLACFVCLSLPTFCFIPVIVSPNRAKHVVFDTPSLENWMSCSSVRVLSMAIHLGAKRSGKVVIILNQMISEWSNIIFIAIIISEQHTCKMWNKLHKSRRIYCTLWRVLTVSICGPRDIN